MKLHSYMSIKDFNDMLWIWPKSNLSAGNSLAHEPVTAPESCRSSIQGISEHGALLDGPFGEYGQATAKGTAVKELAIWEYEAGLVPDTPVVLLGPALLECDDVRLWVCNGNLSSNLSEAFSAEV